MHDNNEMKFNLCLKNKLMMRKTLFYSLLSLGMLGSVQPVQAQQIKGDFDGDWSDCTPWDSNGNKKTSGTQPSGWKISNVYTKLGAVAVGESKTGKNGLGKAVFLENKDMFGQSIPAYLTLGTPWATAETSWTSVRNADGGTFGGADFTYHPDAIGFDYQRGKKKDENATAVAYLWNGSWSQKDVPANTAVGYGNWGTATKTSMENRDRCVLDRIEDGKTLGGEISCTDGATLVALAEASITEGTNGQWQHLEIPFSYNGNESAMVEKINVIFSANDYFGDRSSIVAGNSLMVDNVKLIYYHELKNDEFKYDGRTYKFDDLKSARVDATYDPQKKIVYTKKGVGAKVEEVYDKGSGILTIFVYGEDYDATDSELSQSVSAYTIRFNVEDFVSELAVSSSAHYGTFVAPFDVDVPDGVTAYTCSSLKGESILELKDLDSKIIPAYTPVLVHAEGSAKAIEKGNSVYNADVYTGDLSVSVYGNDYHSKANVAVVNNSDGTFNFVLKNFVLPMGEGLAVGNIVLNRLQKDSDGKFIYDGNTVITAGDLDGKVWMGPMLGVVPVKITSGNVTSESLSVSLNIPFMGMDIGVNFVSVSAPHEVKNYVQPSATYGLLSGVMNETTAPIGSYVLQNQQNVDGVAFYRVLEDDNENEYAKPVLPANRCYLTLPASGDANVKSIAFPTDPTAIDAVRDLLSGKTEIYDLEGRRLPALQKGMNIVNGKKVLVK